MDIPNIQIAVLSFILLSVGIVAGYTLHPSPTCLYGDGCTNSTVNYQILSYQGMHLLNVGDATNLSQIRDFVNHFLTNNIYNQTSNSTNLTTAPVPGSLKLCTFDSGNASYALIYKNPTNDSAGIISDIYENTTSGLYDTTWICNATQCQKSINDSLIEAGLDSCAYYGKI